MPIYEFQCNKCGVKFEELLKDLNNAIVSLICPNCRGRNISRIFSGFAVSSGKTDKKAAVSSDSGKCSGCTASSCSSCSI